jgi:hypothetical protein
MKIKVEYIKELHDIVRKARLKNDGDLCLPVYFGCGIMELRLGNRTVRWNVESGKRESAFIVEYGRLLDTDTIEPVGDFLTIRKLSASGNRYMLKWKYSLDTSTKVMTKVIDVEEVEQTTERNNDDKK